MDVRDGEINPVGEIAGSAAVAERLLGCLRAATQQPALAYAEAPRRISGGFETAIFGFRLEGAPPPFATPLVLRLFRADRPAQAALREAAVQNALAGMGYPAPRVVVAEAEPSLLGGPFLVMERLPGRVLGTSFVGLGEGRSIAGMVRLLLGLQGRMRRMVALWREAQERLHALPVAAFARALEAAGQAPANFSLDAQLRMMQEHIAAAKLVGLEPGLAWLVAQRPPATPPVICHGDLHPLNILVKDGKLSGVVDWSNVTIADPALDVGTSLAIAATVPFAAPPPLRPLIRAAMRRLGRALLRADAHSRPPDSAALRYFQVYCCLRQLMWVGGYRAVGQPLAGGYGTREGVRSLIAHIGAIAGLAVDLPA